MLFFVLLRNVSQPVGASLWHITNYKMRFKLTIEYDGSRYAGWQVQKGERTVQGAFFDACKKIFGETRFEFFGSGRTDTGVHALGQVAHLEVDTKISAERLMLSLNDNLPYDVNVLAVEQANPRFHARFDAVERSYIYLITKRRTAFGKSNAWWIRDELDVEAMRKAAKEMVGRHDFASFTDKNAETPNTIVVINSIMIYEIGDQIAIHNRSPFSALLRLLRGHCFPVLPQAASGFNYLRDKNTWIVVQWQMCKLQNFRVKIVLPSILPEAFF